MSVPMPLLPVSTSRNSPPPPRAMPLRELLPERKTFPIHSLPCRLTRHKGTKISVGGTWIAPRSRAKRAHADTVIPGDDFPGFQDSGYTGDIVHSAVAPAMYMSKQLDDRFTLGLSLNVPYGMITKYNDLWAGRFHGLCPR